MRRAFGDHIFDDLREAEARASGTTTASSSRSGSSTATSGCCSEANGVEPGSELPRGTCGSTRGRRAGRSPWRRRRSARSTRRGRAGGGARGSPSGPRARRASRASVPYIGHSTVADDPALGVCHEEAGGAAEIDGEGAHCGEPIPRLRGNSSPAVIVCKRRTVALSSPICRTSRARRPRAGRGRRRRAPADDPAGERLGRSASTSRRSRSRRAARASPRVRDAVTRCRSRWRSSLPEPLLGLDPLRADAEHDVVRDPGDERPEGRPAQAGSVGRAPGRRPRAGSRPRAPRRRASSPRARAGRAARTGGCRRAASRARLPDHQDEDRRASRARRARRSRCPFGSRSSARSSSVDVSPAAARCSASLRARSWWRAADPAERVRDHPEDERRPDPPGAEREVRARATSQMPEDERAERRRRR